MNGGSSFLSILIDYSLIYQALLSMNIFAVLAIALFPLLAYVRVLLASSDVITRKGIGDAYRDFFVSGKMFILYVMMGSVIFLIMPILRDGFSTFGGVDNIHKQFLALWEYVDNNKEADDITSVLGNVFSWTLGLFSGVVGTAAGFVLYHIVSIAYRLALHLMEVFLATYIVVQYAMGFIAIASKAGGRLLDVSDTWFKSTYAVFLFILFETIILHLIGLVGEAGLRNTLNSINGETLMSKTNWYIHASLYMVLILMGKVMAIGMAANYSNGYSSASALSTMFSISTVIGFLIPRKFMPGSKNAKSEQDDKNTLPQSNGNRTRDKAFRTLVNRIMGRG